MTDTTKERAQLIAEIARELYDRFVMGGWEPQDAYAQIDEWLRRAEHSTETPPPSVAAQTRAMKVAIDYGERVAPTEQSTETPPASDIEQLAVDLCRELYDRFMMGGWTPEDAHAETVLRLQKWAEAPRPVGTPLGRCPKCDSKFRGHLNSACTGGVGAEMHDWHRGPVGTQTEAERGKKP